MLLEECNPSRQDLSSGLRHRLIVFVRTRKHSKAVRCCPSNGKFRFTYCSCKVVMKYHKKKVQYILYILKSTVSFVLLLLNKGITLYDTRIVLDLSYVDYYIT